MTHTPHNLAFLSHSLDSSTWFDMPDKEVLEGADFADTLEETDVTLTSEHAFAFVTIDELTLAAGGITIGKRAAVGSGYWVSAHAEPVAPMYLGHGSFGACVGPLLAAEDTPWVRAARVLEQAVARAIFATPEQDVASQSDQNRQRDDAYVPSRRITGYWARGLAAYYEMSRSSYADIEYEPLFGLDELTHGNLSAEFSTRFRRLVASWGYRQANRLEDYARFSDGTRFNLRVQFQLIDEFEIVPEESGAFLHDLQEELALYLAQGGEFAGDWGYLQFTESGIKLVAKDGNDDPF